MKVNEIFYSIDGEGIRAGSLATFVRLAGCNLNCAYCDTRYACWENAGTEMSIQEILNKLAEIGCKHVTLTGGEPLNKKESFELVQAMVSEGYTVNIETNGSVDICPYLMQNVIVTMDYKTPFSNMEHAMLKSNLSKLRQDDVLKFVCAKSDLERVRTIILNNDIKSWVYLSPVFGEIEPAELVEFLKQLSKDCNTEKIRVQLQMHKYIWDVNKRGV